MIPFSADGAFHPRAGNHELRRLAVRGAFATFSASGIGLVIQVVSTVVLARLLTPADFGVITMVTTFSLLLASFGINGLTQAIIQFDEIDHQTASNLFWFNTGSGLVLAIGLSSAGPLLARFYGNPLVAGVASGVSIGILIQSISVTHLALLMRAMRFSGASANDVIGRVVYTAIPIVLALRGWGYWAIVAGIVGQQVSMTIGAWGLCRWIPSWPRRTGKTSALIRFSMKVYMPFSIAYATQNIDNLLVGWRFNAVALGFYKKAYDLFALTASQVTAPLNNVALSALSRLNQDQVRFRRYLSNALGMIAFAGMAMSADLTLVGKDVVRLALGAKWSESGRIFQIFGPGIGAMLLCYTVVWVHLAVGKPGRLLRWNLVALAYIVSLFLAVLHWGPVGVSAAWSFSYWTLLIPGYWYAGSPIGFRASDLITAIWRYTAAALAAGFTTAALIRDTPFSNAPSSASEAFWAFIIVSALFAVLYLGAVILFHRGMKPLHQLTGLLRELAPSKKASTRIGETVGENQ